jgi:serine phosphatase RsbU (regulator of sigma subunit)
VFNTLELKSQNFIHYKDSLQQITSNTSAADTTRLKASRQLTLHYLMEESNVYEALRTCTNGFQIAQSSKNYTLITKTLSLRGYIYQHYTSDYESAIRDYFKALETTHLSDADLTSDRLTLYINLGTLYYDYKNYSDAEKYLKQGLELAKKLNLEADAANIEFNLASVYQAQNKTDLMLRAYDAAKKYYKKTGSELDLATIDLNLANYTVIGPKDKITEHSRRGAVSVYKRVKEIFKEAGVDSYYLAAITGLGVQLTELGELSESMKYLKEAEELGRQYSDFRSLENIYLNLAENFRKQGIFQEQAAYLSLLLNTRDSLFNENKSKAIAEVQIKYQTEQTEADKEKLLQQSKIKDLELSRRDAELTRSRTIRFTLLGGLSLIVIFAFFLFNRLQVMRKQKKIIEKQKRLVEEKQKEVQDSILYARRIQAAVLPSMRRVREMLPESFVLYLPKDIVAGDFYWLESPPTSPLPESENETVTLFAAADCTGHGVPGAMVSVICNNGLNRAVREHGLTIPGEILDKAREIVIQEFEKSEDDVKDGMDISLVALTHGGPGGHLLLKWAGANNPIWIINPNRTEWPYPFIGGEGWGEIKPNKQPIGKYTDAKPFTTHTAELQKGDTIYIFTDGFQDQFGGEKGKKYKASNLKNFLLSIAYKPLKEQRTLLHQEFDQWKGTNEQVDDVCVIGVRI